MIQDSPLIPVLAFFGGLAAIVGIVAFLLHLRDRIAKSQGRTPEQVQARFFAALQFRSTIERCIPGLIVIAFGSFYVYDRSREHESDWWIGLLFIPAGWVLVLLLARKSWRRYLELRRLAEKGEAEYEYISSEPPSGGGE
jgi:hypothetical protein